MKITVNNLGALNQAEFTLGQMTILCGSNNTGKTYATYALFGFLKLWRNAFSVRIDREIIKELLNDGTANINLSEYVKKADEIIENGCKAYSNRLSVIFAAQEDRFKDTAFKVTLEPKDISIKEKYNRVMRVANDAELFSLSKAEQSSELIITLLVEKEKLKTPERIIVDIIQDSIRDILFAHLFPSPFIASAERTGAAIFRKELDFARNRLLEEMTQTTTKIDPMELLFKTYQDYALPVKTNVDFTRELEKTAKKNSFIAVEHKEVLEEFKDIIGGEYTVTRNDELYYIPKGKKIRLTMDESSSAVRSLLDIGFYLKHIAKRGDLLMIDEPELNLHPENQCRVARLLSRLVNLGINVFITTHSDYIIKEINTLIMLNGDKPHLKAIAQREGYHSDELLSPSKLRVYIAEESLRKKEGRKRRSNCQTLTPAEIDPILGIEVKSFDKTIDKMNSIQDEIIWGAAEK